jgi:beta-phosphoglucomutase-like phosphatase (HAD superfamily)
MTSNAQNGATRPSLSIRGIRNRVYGMIFGIEGQAIDTEEIHYQKWLQVADETKIISNESDFRKLWRKKFIGIGDKGIFDYLHDHYAPFKEEYPLWAECQQVIDEIYKDKIKTMAKIPAGMRKAIEAADALGIPYVFVTHAKPPLAEEQFTFIKSETGISFKLEDVVFDQKKDKEAYSFGLKLLDAKLKAAGKPPLQAKDIVVFDNKEEYLLQAEKLGFNAAKMVPELEEHLRPQGVQRFESISWADIHSAVAASSPKPVGERSNFNPYI